MWKKLSPEPAQIGWGLMGRMSSLRAWKAIYYVHLLESVVYPATWVIWILTDAVTCFAMPLVFAAAAGNGTIQGYARSDFFAYYGSLLMITSFVTCHLMWELSYEIKEGIFSAQLVRPVNYLEWTFVRNLAWRVTRMCMAAPIVGLLVLSGWGDVHLSQFHFSVPFVISLVLGNVVSFMIASALGMVALFVTEATSIFELYYIPMLFLSGVMFPIAMLPHWAQSLAKYFPFYYTTGVPTEMLIGQLSGDRATTAIIGQLIWIVLAYLLFRFLWKKGMPRYTGVGM